MAKHRVRVGLHSRNDVHFPEHDYTLVRQARIETLKMMSFTDVGVYDRLRRENPGIEFIVRLYDDRLSRDSRPSPGDFVSKMVPYVTRLRPYATKFEIHNEPNHATGIEGWGSSDESARAFKQWYVQVLGALKQACPWAQFGFPGLALNHPHRDLEWLDICRDIVLASDWLGCHCYWQYDNLLNDQWGLRFKLYQKRFPNKEIEITEFGDSTPNLSRDKMANEYARFYRELNKYSYLGSASAFIASSPDPAWAPFAWMKEDGEMLPVVDAVRNVSREPVEVPVPPAPQPPTKPPASPTRTFSQTGKTVRGSFLKFLDQYGLDICGYPITEQFEEEGVPAQYFQRVGLEEFKPGKVRLKLAGSEAWAARKKIAQLEAQIKILMEYGEPGQQALIASLHEQIEALQDEIERLKKRLPTPPPTPSPVAEPVAVSRPAIEDVVEKLSRHPEKRYRIRAVSAIENLVIHHSGVPSMVGPASIANYHVHRLEWPAAGYHFMVAADGIIYQCNTLQTVSYHTTGANIPSVGICFLGNYTTEVPPSAQIQAGAHLAAWLMQELDLALGNVKGHREFTDSICPGNQWLEGKKWKRILQAEIAKAQPQAAGSDGQDTELVSPGRTGQQALSFEEQVAVSGPVLIKAYHSPHEKEDHDR